jgi:hypothetical protein
MNFLFLITLVAGGILALIFHRNLLFSNINTLTNKSAKVITQVVEEDLQSQEELIQIFKSKKRVQIKGKEFLNLQIDLNTSFKVEENYSKTLDAQLQSLYIISVKLEYLRQVKYITQLEYNSYIKIVSELLKDEFAESLDNFKKGYPYHGKRHLLATQLGIDKLNSFLDEYKIPVKKQEIQVVEDVVIKSEYYSETITAITEKHSKLNNVISKSLYENAMSLYKSLEAENLSKDTILMIENQIKQIDDFLDNEIKLVVNETELEFVNRLKANQLYLDSLKINWISEK